jgi:SAM-dependent methyltransferase
MVKEGSMVVTAPELLTRWAPAAPVQRALVLGAGGGDEAVWLAREGFQIDGVESDPERSARLAATCAGMTVSVWPGDMLDFAIRPKRYGLIVGLAVLHFIAPQKLPGLAERIASGLAPGGLLLAQVLTVDDPSCQERRSRGEPEVSPNTFHLGDGLGLIHYFGHGELRPLFVGLETLESDVYRFTDDVREAGFGAGETLVCRRPAEDPA